MKKSMTVLTATVCGTLLMTATPTQAAPKDPVRALKAQLVAGHGVRFADTTTTVDDDGKELLMRRQGAFQFSKKGMAAADITAKMSGPLGAVSGMNIPERAIAIGKVTYLSGGMWKKKMPAGKSWYKSDDFYGGAAGYFGQPINPVEPATLARLINKAKKVKNAYTGKITFKELDKVSPWFHASIPLRSHDDTEVSYTLTVGAAGLVTKVTSSYAATGVFDSGTWEGKTFAVETRFTGWGGKVSIKAPDAKKVTTKLEE